MGLKLFNRTSRRVELTPLGAELLRRIDRPYAELEQAVAETPVPTGDVAGRLRIDLTQLEFIDSTGVRELMCALDSSRRDGSRLSVGTDMTRAVRRVVEIVGVGSYFRPDDG